MIVATFRDAPPASASSSAAKLRALDRFDTPSGDEGDDDADVVEVRPPSGARAGKETHVGWAYVGSHNFTPSAWGTLSGTSFTPTLNVRRPSFSFVPILGGDGDCGGVQVTNFELGVLVPLRSEAELERVACWERPPRRYVLGKDEPWVRAPSCGSRARGADEDVCRCSPSLRSLRSDETRRTAGFYFNDCDHVVAVVYADVAIQSPVSNVLC
jgi:tyrosyl-DNA phosphodiesterase 1